jgi:hypothetical protein
LGSMSVYYHCRHRTENTEGEPMSEQAVTAKVSVKPSTRDKFNTIRAELVLLGEPQVKLHEVMERAADAYLEHVRRQKGKQRSV